MREPQSIDLQEKSMFVSLDKEVVRPVSSSSKGTNIRSQDSMSRSFHVRCQITGASKLDSSCSFVCKELQSEIIA